MVSTLSKDVIQAQTSNQITLIDLRYLYKILKIFGKESAIKISKKQYNKLLEEVVEIKEWCKLMKRFLAVILSFVLCFSMVGCSNNKNAVQLDETVLNKDFEFYSTEYKTTMTLSEYLDYLQDSSNDGSCFYINEYTLFDLDFDGNNELICRLGQGEDIYFGTVVFHAIENIIYSYNFTWRQFGVLKTDGTVPYSLSAFDNGFRTLTFDKEGYNSKSSTYSEGVWGDRDIIGMNYYINDKKTTKEKFDKANQEHDKIDDVKFENFYLDKHTFKYLDFISLKTKGLDREGKEIDFSDFIQEVLPVKSISDEFISYGFYDMNHDGIVEMSVVSSGVYAYFTIKNDVVTAWSEIQSIYTYPLENGNLMFERHGGAPEHINYEYYELDFDGNIIKTISFSEWHPTAEDGGKEEYFFNDNSVTKDEYSKLTKQYLDYKKALIEWFNFNELIFK